MYKASLFKGFIFLFRVLVCGRLIIALTLPVSEVRAASILVTSNADTVAVNGQCTLREAIVNANNDAATNVDCSWKCGDIGLRGDLRAIITPLKRF